MNKPAAGRSVTDLPIRQCYYMGTECDQAGGENTFNSLLMASYNDIGTVPFWKGLEDGPEFIGYTPRSLEGRIANDAVVPRTQFQISDEMVRIAQRQVTQLHAQVELPAPYSAVYHAWDADPYGGGWHEWKANYRLDLIIQKMRHPVKDQQVFIVGEAYSYGQGWVEGALTTAESALQEFFELPRPNWLPASYQLLPTPAPALDYTALASGYGALGYRVETVDELERWLPQLLMVVQRPVLVEVKIAEKDFAEQIKRLAGVS